MIELERPGCGDPALLAALASPASYPQRPDVVVHETHASWVFVAGDHAYKVKKPVALGFLDYSTLERRREACHEEVRVNRELAPEVYLGVRAIVADDGGFRLAPDGTRGAVEYAVEMRTFDEADTLAGLIAAGTLERADIVGAARLLADFHRSAPLVGDWGPERVAASWQTNLQELDAIPHPDAWRLDVVGGFAAHFIDAHAGELRRRARDGLARDGHGDLRCEHVLARPTVAIVDRIEFDPQLRRIDVACDLAFLAMDLEAHGQRAAARELLDAYRDAGLDPGDEILRSFYAAHWALVRAKVALVAAEAREGQARAQRFSQADELWQLSERMCWRARGPLALVICGPAASGKSLLATEISCRSEIPVVSSDLVRKRLAGVERTEPARGEHYSPAFTRATYEQLGNEALLLLQLKDRVIVDASCRSRADRALLIERLRRARIRLLFVRCEVPLELALKRAAERLEDPQRVSDATPQIVEQQFRSFEELEELPPDSRLGLDATQPLAEQVADVARAVDRLAPAGASARAGGEGSNIGAASPGAEPGHG